MKQELDKTIQTLLNDPMFAITVSNIDASGKEFRVVTNFSNTDLVKNYGSAKDFFESLYKNGVKKIKVCPRKRNGAKNGVPNFKPAGLKNPTFEVEFEPKNNAEKVETKNEALDHAQKSFQAPMNMSNHSLNGGLSGADVYKVFDHQRLHTENIELKSKNDSLQKEVERLKEENLKAEILGVKKIEQTEATAKLMAGASPFIPLIQALLMGAKGQNQEAGAIPLNQGISQLKQWFLNQDESLLQDLLPIIKGMEIPECDAEIQELLLKYNLIVQNNAS